MEFFFKVKLALGVSAVVHVGMTLAPRSIRDFRHDRDEHLILVAVVKRHRVKGEAEVGDLREDSNGSRGPNADGFFDSVPNFFSKVVFRIS